MRSTGSLLALLAATIPETQAWWQPGVATSWQINLSNASQVVGPFPKVNAFDADLFDVSSSQWSALKNANIKTICYFSAGSWENWRPDASDFPKSVLGKPLDGWQGERWLDIRANATRTIMLKRLDLAVSKGCDAVDPDNVDAYDNGGGGFNLTAADSTNYVNFLAAQAHQRGMAVGLKNAGAIIPKVLPNVDFAVNEQCVQYQECDTTAPFTKSGKPVFGLEYPKTPITQSEINAVCNSSYRPKNFETLIKYLNLNETYWACAVTP